MRFLPLPHTSLPFPLTPRRSRHTLKPPIADFRSGPSWRSCAQARTRQPHHRRVQAPGAWARPRWPAAWPSNTQGPLPRRPDEIDLQGRSPNPLTPSKGWSRSSRAFHPEAGPLPEKLDDLRARLSPGARGQRALLLLDNARDKAQVGRSCRLLLRALNHLRHHFNCPRCSRPSGPARARGRPEARPPRSRAAGRLPSASGTKAEACDAAGPGPSHRGHQPSGEHHLHRGEHLDGCEPTG